MKIVAGAREETGYYFFFSERRYDYKVIGANVPFVAELEGHKPGVYELISIFHFLTNKATFKMKATFRSHGKQMVKSWGFHGETKAVKW